MMFIMGWCVGGRRVRHARDIWALRRGREISIG